MPSNPRVLTRRSLLTASALGLAGATLSACSKPQAPDAAASAPPSSRLSAAATGTTPPSSSTPTSTVVRASSGSALPSSQAAASASPQTTSSTPQVSTSPSPSTPSSVSNATTPAAAGSPVHIRLYENDGRTYGIGMPIIVYLSKAVTDAKPFAKATTVTVNGQKVEGAWFFQKSLIYPDYPLEAHYRTQTFWPAHAVITVDLPTRSLPAGKGLTFNDSLTLTMKTGAANVTTVDGATERLTLTTDGKTKFNFPVSLGKATTPTFTGTKVVMARNRVKRMIGTTPGDLYDLQVPWSVRLTNSGEFIHAASWNGGNIGQRSTSNGCTNLNVAAAQEYFNFAQIGDVALYRNTGGGPMPSWDGYGDWNTPWSTWTRGGLLANS